MRTATIGAALAVWLTWAPPVNAVSFSCLKASKNVELMICAEPVLSELDDRLAAAFATAKRQSPNPAQIISEERAWLSRRDQCETVECVVREYRSRLAELGGDR